MAVDTLCREDATLLTANTIFRFIFAESRNRHSPIVQKASEVVQKRVSKRRLCNLVSLLRYLDDAKILRVPDDEF